MNDPQGIPWSLSDMRAELKTMKDITEHEVARRDALTWAQQNNAPSRYDCHWCGRSWTEPAGDDRWINGICRMGKHHAGAEVAKVEVEEAEELVNA